MAPKKPPQKPTVTPPVIEEPAPPRKKRTPWYIALLSTGVVLLAASVVLALLGTVDVWEQRAFAVINHVDLPAWAAAQVAKPLSNAVWGMVILVVVLLVVPKYRLLAWQYAVAAGSSYAVVFILEHIVDRARPVGLAGYDAVLRAAQGGPGFPSGHVAVLTALGLTIWPFVSWPWRVLIVVLIVSEAWARIFLGLHAPLDIVGGIAVAMTVVGIIHLTPAKIRKPFRVGA
jgi:membrane-associated phospholipid phosphatase